MCKYYDVIVIGTGIAGLFTALSIDESLKVLMVTKSSLDNGNSTLAQGGIVSCINPKVHFEDTMKAGSFYNKEQAIRVIAKDSQKNIDRLIAYGVNFDRDEDGNLKLTREGGHRESTILYSKDITGKEIIRALNNEINKRENINILENTLAIELLKTNQVINGMVSLDKNRQVEKYTCKTLVLATGGVGRIYKNTTNADEITGDGIALAYKIGAKVKDMEFIQFHPTALYGDDYERRFLISEAVRGEGAILRNINGEAFMNKYHDMGDLAPRDVVARSIFKEMKITKSDFVYLDITHKDSNDTKERFPNIYKHCLSKGIDMTKEYIRVAPAEHYIMGGIETDLYGKTNIVGLYACGECACTGTHGANRLASNSLLEGIVFGGRVAKSINTEFLNKAKEKKEIKIKSNDKQLECFYGDKIGSEYIHKFQKIENELREAMTEDVSIVRNKQSLMSALGKINMLDNDLGNEKILNIKYFELKNMITVSKLIIKGALKRTESIGSHFIAENDWSEKDC